MMLPISIAFIFISLVSGIVCYFSTGSIIFAANVCVVYLLTLFLFQYKKIKNYFSLSKRVHACYFFINSFIITLSVKESYDEGIESALRIEDQELHLYVNELGDLSSYEKVKYLRNYFRLAIYKMFLNILEVYQDQGGNILNISDNLIREATRTEKTLTDSSALGLKHLIEFIVLWSLSFAILLFMKFGLKEFYDKMLENQILPPLVLVYFLICLLSINMFIKSFTKLSIKEDSVQ